MKQLNSACLFCEPPREGQRSRRTPDWQRPFVMEELLWRSWQQTE